MLKKIALIGLISIGSLYGAEEPTPPLKKLHTRERGKISLWFKAIIPSILSYASMEAIVRVYKNDPAKQQLVSGAKYAQWLPAIIGAYCLNIWMDTDLKEWMLRKPDPTT